MKSIRLVALVLLAATACGSDCVEVGVTDNGFHVADDGVTLHPGMLPAAVGVDDTVDDPTLLPEALAWCNARLSQDAVLREATLGETPRVIVSIGFVPAPDWGETFEDMLNGSSDPVGITYLDYAEDGEVLGAEIVLSSDVAYDRDTLVKVLEHEIFHFLALSDDPGIDITVELRSIMSSPLDPLGDLTEHDYVLLFPYLPEA
jgi:hypothetical protein